MINVDYGDVTGQYDDSGNLVGAYYNDTGEQSKQILVQENYGMDINGYYPGDSNYDLGTAGVGDRTYYETHYADENLPKKIDPNNIEGSIKNWANVERNKGLVGCGTISFVVIYIIGGIVGMWHFSWLVVLFIALLGIIFSVANKHMK